MRPAVADRVVWSVCRSVTVVSPAKTTEPMPFGLRTRLGPRNHILDGVLIPKERTILRVEGAAHCKVYKVGQKRGHHDFFT